MANEKQFRLRTRYIATRDVKEYRATIPTWVNAEDVVLEIGCEWGTTTVPIAQRARRVVGTDISPDCIGRARRDHPHQCAGHVRHPAPGAVLGGLPGTLPAGVAGRDTE